MFWRVSGLLFALVLAAGPVELGHAELGGLVWEAPVGCPTQLEVEVRLAEFPEKRRARIDAKAVVRERDGGFELALTMEAGSARSERLLHAEACSTLLDVAVFSYFAALEGIDEATPVSASLPVEPAPQVVDDPTLDAPTIPARDSVASQNAAAPSIAASAPAAVPTYSGSLPEIDRTGRHARRVSAALRAHAGIGLGPLGAPSAPFGGSFALLGAAWRVELGAVGYLPRNFALDGVNRSSTISAWSVRGRGCGVVPLNSRLELPLCAGFAGGLLHARGVGLNESLTPTAPHLGASAAALLRVAITPTLGFLLETNGGLNLLRPAFHLDGDEPFFRAPAGLASAEIALEARFGGRSKESLTRRDQGAPGRRLEN